MAADDRSPPLPLWTQATPAAGRPGTDADGVQSVADVNAAAKGLLERHFGRVKVRGEIADLRFDRNSGHRYFTLKDAQASLPVALFRGSGQRLRFEPNNGQQVIAVGQLTLYVRGGRYQIIAAELVPAGEGALQAALLAIRQRLLADGLLDPTRKRPLPVLPRRVAVITSAEGAVWRDIVQVARRRYGAPPLLLVPARVQGAQAVADLLQALERLARWHVALEVDVVIVARGGGSLEDLLAFSDERLARALAAMPIPCVSAIGHETDVSILDLVADVRAPTPSAAAELVFAQRLALAEHLRGQSARLVRASRQRLERLHTALSRAHQRLGDGQRLIWPRSERLSEAALALERLGRRALSGRRQAVAQLERRLGRQRPTVRIGRLARRRLEASGALEARMRLVLGQAARRLAESRARLEALSPLSVLGRGYALVTQRGGTVVRDAAAVEAHELLTIRLQRGVLQAKSEPPSP